MQARSLTTKQNRLLIAVLVLVSLLYIGYRAANTIPIFPYMRPDADTNQYRAIAKLSLLDKDFYTGDKPFVTALIIKFAGNKRIYIGHTFLWFSIASWLFLATQFSYSLRNPVIKVGGFSFILIFSLVRNIIGWDTMLLSESLSISFLVFLIALWLSILREWKPWKTGSIIFTSFLWVFTRDTNAYLALMIAVSIILLAIFFKETRRYLIIAAVLVTLFILSTISSNIGERWVSPFEHVLMNRIWISKEDTGFFKSCGMPTSPEIYAMAGQLNIDEDWLLKDEFDEWMRSSGKSCYYRWLLSDISRTLQAPLSELEKMMGYDKKEFSPNFEPLLPYRLEKILYPYQNGLALVLIAFFGAGLAFRQKLIQNNSAWLAVIWLVLFFLPHAILVWYADTDSIDRHALQANIQFYLGFWMGVILAVDLLWQKLISKK